MPGVTFLQPDDILENKKNSKNLWLRIAGTILSIGLLAWLISQQDYSNLGEVFTRIPKASLWWMALLMIISRVAVMGRWLTLISSGGARISVKQSFEISLAGLFATNFLPTTIGGDFIRLVGAVRLGIDSALATASLVMDRLVGMAGMVLALPFSLPYLLQSLPEQTSLLLPLPAFLDKWYGKLRQFIQSMWDVVKRWFKQPRGLIAALFFTLIHTICFFTIQWLALDGMGENLSFWTVAGLYVLVYFITLLPISINGYGLQELSVTLVYSQLAGASQEASLTAALILRTLTILASLPGAIFLPSLLKPAATPSSETESPYEA
mgnify:FL=1